MADYPINTAPVACRRAAGGQPSHGSQLTLIHWVAQRWVSRWATGRPLEAGHLWAYSSILLPTSVPTDVPLHWLWLPIADVKSPLCQLQWYRVGFEPSTTCWIVEAGLLCAEPPHDYQLPTGGLLDVIWQPPLLPLYHHSPLGGQLQNVCRDIYEICDFWDKMVFSELLELLSSYGTKLREARCGHAMLSYWWYISITTAACLCYAWAILGWKWLFLMNRLYCCRLSLQVLNNWIVWWLDVVYRH